MSITFKEFEIIAHSLGINLLHAKTSQKKRDKRLPKDFYRNRFCTSIGHTDLPLIENLERVGYMAKGQTINDGRDTLWYVTDLGIYYFRTKWEKLVTTEKTIEKSNSTIKK